VSARRSLSPLLLIAAALLFGAAPAGAAAPTVDVVEISGPMDGRLIEFAMDAITDTDASLVVLKVDSLAVVDADIDALLQLVADPPVPVAVWVGPAPAVAHGGAAQLLLASQLRGAAPGTRIGYLSPTVNGTADDAEEITAAYPDVPADLLANRVDVEGHIPGLVDIISPSIGQFVTGLDGSIVDIGGEPVTLATAVTETVDGVEVTKQAGEVRFLEPGLITRTLRITVRPEAAFLFLVMGIAMIVLEIYAAGPGVAATMGAICLAMAGYGFAVLPTNWWAAGIALAGLLLYVFDFQRNDLGIASLAGTGLLLWGGLALIDGGDQMPVLWWSVVLIVIGAALFFGFALTSLSRSRFSTSTIGREHLVGATGVALGPFDPEGLVEVDGARWRAITRRVADISEGDAVTVIGVRGVVLDVERS
jgi:membrane-bound serine protease (ClpP class)